MTDVVPALRAILEFSWAYRLFGSVIGAHAARETFVREHVRPVAGMRILDIGCGPGTLVPYLDGTEYVGFDSNPDYIDAARARYGDRVQLVCERVSEHVVRELSGFDVAIASGILHHLDDVEAIQLMQIARSSLKAGGRLVTFDGCYADGQRRMARLILSRDRGRHVRTRDEYARLASTAFADVSATVRSDLLRIPYTHVILECRK